MLRRVLTFLGQTHGEVGERIMFLHTPALTQVQPYPTVVDEGLLKATSSPKETGDVVLMIYWMLTRIKEVEAKYLL